VRTQNNEVVVVPNTVLTTEEVTRPYGRDDFRMTVELSVDYDEDIPAVMDALREEAAAVEGVTRRRDPLVRVLDFGPDAVQLRVEIWVRNPDRLDIVTARSDYLQRVAARFDEMGVAINPPAKRELSGGVALGEGSDTAD
jgi:small conductance mechanosensitive channel